jgi:hypothetical protein
LDQMKYLGAWMAANGSNTPELNARLDGAWAKWASFKHIWYDNEQPIKAKKMFFTSLVYNTAISAQEAFVLSDAENDRITCFVVKRARALLCGRAYKVHGDKTDKMTNSQVLKKVQILPVHQELRIRKLKWAKSLARDPNSSGCMFAAWFGVFTWDKTDPKSNPYTIQLSEDIRDLSKIDLIDDDMLTRVIADPMLIFTNQNATRWFDSIDLDELRARYMHNLDNVYCRKTSQQDKPSHIVECDIHVAPGVLCSYKCHSLNEFAHHKVRSELPGHDLRNHVNRLVVTNQCPFCSTVSADTITAQHHLCNSYVKGFCCVDSSYKLVDPIVPHKLICPWSHILDEQGTPVCNFEADHLKQLHMHVVSHVDWAPTIHLREQPDLGTTSTNHISHHP